MDVYIPHNRISPWLSTENVEYQELFSYDVNSLYPTVMCNNPMPRPEATSKPIAFEGDIRRIDPEAFGYFYCKIESPHNLEHPILQRRIKTVNGLRTIAAACGN